MKKRLEEIKENLIKLTAKIEILEAIIKVK